MALTLQAAAWPLLLLSCSGALLFWALGRWPAGPARALAEALPFDLIDVIITVGAFQVLNADLERYRETTRAFLDLQTALLSAAKGLTEYVRVPMLLPSSSGLCPGPVAVEEHRVRLRNLDAALRDLKLLLAALPYAAKHRFRNGTHLDVRRLPVTAALQAELDPYEDTVVGVTVLLYRRVQRLQELGVYTETFITALTPTIEQASEAVVEMEKQMRVSVLRALRQLYDQALLLWLLLLLPLQLGGVAGDALHPLALWAIYVLLCYLLLGAVRVGRATARPFDRPARNPLLDVRISDLAHRTARLVHNVFDGREREQTKRLEAAMLIPCRPRIDDTSFLSPVR